MSHSWSWVSTFCFEKGSNWPRTHRDPLASAEIKGLILNFFYLTREPTVLKCSHLTINLTLAAESKDGCGWLFLLWETQLRKGRAWTQPSLRQLENRWSLPGWQRSHRGCHWYCVSLSCFLERKRGQQRAAQEYVALSVWPWSSMTSWKLTTCGCQIQQRRWGPRLALGRRETSLFPPVHELPSAASHSRPFRCSSGCGHGASSTAHFPSWWGSHSHWTN